MQTKSSTTTIKHHINTQNIVLINELQARLTRVTRKSGGELLRQNVTVNFGHELP